MNCLQIYQVEKWLPLAPLCSTSYAFIENNGVHIKGSVVVTKLRKHEHVYILNDYVFPTFGSVVGCLFKGYRYVCFLCHGDGSCSIQITLVTINGIYRHRFNEPWSMEIRHQTVNGCWQIINRILDNAFRCVWMKTILNIKMNVFEYLILKWLSFSGENNEMIAVLISTWNVSVQN